MTIPILLAIILIEGFVSISVEILTIRQLIPFVGNSVIVTSLIIGVFLLFLAIGYWRGGQYTDNFHQVLKNNFTKAALFLGLGLSYVFCMLFFYGTQTYLGLHLLLSLTLYLLLILAPTIYWLGQTVPITTNLFRLETTVGAISGKVLFLSTVGSFFGAIGTTLLLFNFFGIAATVVINYLLLVFLILILYSSTGKDIFRFSVMMALALLVHYLNIHVENVIFVKTNNYANYRVQENFQLGDETGRVFVVNDSLSSFLNDNNQGAQYIELIKKLLFKDLGLKQKSFLVIGAGGFTLSAESDYGNQFTYLDIDSAIKPLAEKYFINDIKGRFITADARVFLKNQPQTFDVIVSDAFNNRNAVPAHLLTKEYLHLIHQRLKRQGLAVFNIIANPLLSDDYSKRIDNTLSAVFPNCMKVPTQYHDQLTNIIYICQTSALESEAMVYTDDKNPLTMDFFNTVH